MASSPQFLSAEQLADRLGLALSTVRTAPSKGTLDKPDSHDPETGEARWSAELVEAIERRRSKRRTTSPWWANLQKVRAQYERHGSFTRAGPATKRWIDQQIKALRAGRLNDEKQRALHGVGITAETPTQTETRQMKMQTIFLKELDWWVREHGSANVPQHATSRPVEGRPYKLGKQVSQMRLAHNRNELADVLVAACESRPGWVWDGQQGRWETRAAELADYVDKHGSLEGLGLPLRKWLLRQREAAGDLRLTAAQRKRLTAIPGALVPTTAVAEFVSAAQRWLTTHPGQTMYHLRFRDSVTVDGQEYPLGKRATYYRRRAAGLEGTHPLSDQERSWIERLPGWSWDLGPRRRPGRDY